MQSLSFDNMVELYDETRAFDRGCFHAALDYLVERFQPAAFGQLFEPGIGTGRIAIPLAERRYRVTGTDISEAMLVLLRQRLTQASRLLPVSFVEADATASPFPAAAFDIAVVVHLFYFIREWRRAADELLRVVKSGNPLVLMHTGTGAEIPFLNRRYKELCAEQGCSITGVGVGSTREVVDYFCDLGCHVEWIRDRWQWTAYIRLDKAISYVASRAYSFTTVAPDDVHSIAIGGLESELERQFGSLKTQVEVPNQIYLVVIRK